MPVCERLRRAFHWSNLQALFASINGSKGRKSMTNFRWSKSLDRWVYTGDGTPNAEKVRFECENEVSTTKIQDMILKMNICGRLKIEDDE
jgi:hypothetical protein